MMIVGCLRGDEEAASWHHAWRAVVGVACCCIMTYLINLIEGNSLVLAGVGLRKDLQQQAVAETSIAGEALSEQAMMITCCLLYACSISGPHGSV